MYPNTGPNATPDGLFTDGNPFVKNPSVPSSLVGAQFLNTVTRELLAVLAEAGIEPAIDQFDQIAQAIIVLAQIHGGGGGGGEVVTGANAGAGVGVFKDKTPGAPALLNFRSIGAGVGDSGVSITLDGDVVRVSALGAAGAARGVIRLAGQIGGTADAPDVRGLRNSDGTLLPMGDVPEGTFFKRLAGVIVGGTPAGGGDVSGPGAIAGLGGRLAAYANDTGELLGDSDVDVVDVARVRRPTSWYRTEGGVIVRASGTGLYIAGPGRVPELDGAETLADDALGAAVLLTPASEAYSEVEPPPGGSGPGGVCGLRYSEWDETRGGFDGGYRLEFDTPATLTSLRLWAGLWSRDPSSLALPGAGHECASARFDSGAGDGTSGKWRLVTSGGGGTNNVVEASSGTGADTVPAATRVVVELFPRWAAGVLEAWELWVDEVFLCESLLRLPNTTAKLATTLRSVNLSTSARAIKFRRLSYYFLRSA